MFSCHFLFVSTQSGLQESKKKTQKKQLNKTNHIPNLVWLRSNTGTSIKMLINDSKADINDLHPHSTSLPTREEEIYLSFSTKSTVLSQMLTSAADQTAAKS